MFLLLVILGLNLCYTLLNMTFSNCSHACLSVEIIIHFYLAILFTLLIYLFCGLPIPLSFSWTPICYSLCLFFCFLLPHAAPPFTLAIRHMTYVPVLLPRISLFRTLSFKLIPDMARYDFLETLQISLIGTYLVLIVGLFLLKLLIFLANFNDVAEIDILVYVFYENIIHNNNHLPIAHYLGFM